MCCCVRFLDHDGKERLVRLPCCEVHRRDAIEALADQAPPAEAT